MNVVNGKVERYQEINDMDWIQVLTIVGANFGFGTTMFLWLRKESNADRRELSSAIKNISDAIQEEMKDFHGRLCTIEERNKAK